MMASSIVLLRISRLIEEGYLDFVFDGRLTAAPEEQRGGRLFFSSSPLSRAKSKPALGKERRALRRIQVVPLQTSTNNVESFLGCVGELKQFEVLGIDGSPSYESVKIY